MRNLKLLVILLLLANSSLAQKQIVTDVWVVFKTHFDLGFTDLPENVFERYRVEMMDNALGVIEKNARNKNPFGYTR